MGQITILIIIAIIAIPISGVVTGYMIFYLLNKKKDTRNNSENILLEERQRNFKQELDGINTKLTEFSTNFDNAMGYNNSNLQSLQKSYSDFTGLMKNNQQRGGYGEQIAVDMLLETGMLEGFSWEKQKALTWTDEKESKLIPDFTFKLLGEEKIFNMDSKFPFSNFERIWQQNGDVVEEEKKKFISAVRKHITTVSKYINTSENTVDLAAMFIPVPRILDAIISLDNDIVNYAIKNKVVLVSPANFYALITFIKHSELIFNLHEQQEEIMKRFKDISNQYQKYSEGFEDIEKKLSSLTQSINNMKETRTKMLGNSVKKIKELLEKTN